MRRHTEVANFLKVGIFIAEVGFSSRLAVEQLRYRGCNADSSRYQRDYREVARLGRCVKQRVNSRNDFTIPLLQLGYLFLKYSTELFKDL